MLHHDNNGVRILNFATSKNVGVKSMRFQHRDIQNYNWTSPEGKTHIKFDHILIDMRWHSSILDVRSYRRNEKRTYKKLYLECCSLWIRTMDPREKWREDHKCIWNMELEKRMLKIKWTDRITNDEVFQKAKEERLFLKNERNRRHS